MKAIWKLQDAKSQFSQLVKDALTGGPQFITRRGDETVVVISIQEYEKLTSGKPGFKEFLLSCPKMDKSFKIERQKDYPRRIVL
jgi:prevent-host-death family protein